MARSRAQPSILAKLAPPRLPRIIQRTRAFTLLDHSRDFPVTWVMGAPGSGKTTLVAHYVDTRDLRGLWYQLDEGDGDVASSFHYFRLAMQTVAARYKTPLPHFTAEYRASLPIFTRRFFEELYRRLKGPFVLVLDNYQTVPVESSLHEVLALACELLPPAGRCLVMSRQPPPPVWAHLQARQALHLFDPEALRLTDDEAVELVQLHSTQHRWRPTDPLIAQMRVKTSGWLAGLVLLLEQARLTASTQEVCWTETPEVVFDYLAREVIKGLAPQVREFLLSTSVLPTMTEAMAQQLTGLPTAGQILRRLYHARQFTERRLETTPIYQYHPLFREFLQSEARQSISPDQRRAIQERAARLLEANGQVEAAVAAWEAMGDTSEQLRIILTQAPLLMAQGRAETLEGWLKNLPTSTIEQTPWALFWLGICALISNPRHGQSLVEKAFQKFTAQADQVGMLVSTCAMVESMIGTWVNVMQLHAWSVRLKGVLSDIENFASPDVEARATCALFIAQQWLRPNQHAMSPLADRVEAIMQRAIDPTQATLIAFLLIVYKCWVSDWDAVKQILHKVNRTRETMRMPPLAQIWLVNAESTYAFSIGDPAVCLKRIEEGRLIAHEHGLESTSGVLLTTGALGALAAGDIITAERFLAEAQSVTIALQQHIRGWVAILRGDFHAARKCAEDALKFCMDGGWVFPEAFNRIAVAQALHELNKDAEAVRHLARVQQIIDDIGSSVLDCMYGVLTAQMAFDRGDEQQGLQCLQRTMAIARERHLVNWLWWRPDVMGRLCAKALGAGIEVDFVRHLIVKRNLKPDTAASPCLSWPWALQIFALGTFRVLVNGQPLQFSRKTQQRPLDLLKALIAFGCEEVLETTLTDALWPEADGDAGHQAFAVTLHRLRKLIRPESLALKGGRLSLRDTQACFIDVKIFERLLEQAGAASRQQDEKQAHRLREQALSLYTGAFLADNQAPWAEALRERLREKLTRAILQHKRLLETSGQREAAELWDEKGREINPSAEEIRSL